MTEEPDRCKKRFKGVENFLRRIAFNLGNTPSQTEVKIISCIPIDVTDLQQKIIYLEKQLEEDKAQAQAQPAAEASAAPPDATEQAKKSRQASIHTAIGTPTFLRTPKIGRSCKEVNYQYSQPCAEDASRKSSGISFLYPTYADSKECITLSVDRINASKMYDDCYNDINEGRMNGQKKKKSSNKKKVKTHLVYYTHTDNSPFKKYSPSLKPIADNEILSRTYLSRMVRKQYKPSFVGGFSDFSHFTAPICRDTDSNDNEIHSYESDMCSCCHGAFHNIDTHTTNKNIVPSPLVPKTVIENNRNAYYDSSLYDLVPVKEKPCKINRDPENKRKRNKHQENPKYCPDYVRTKSEVHPLIINYQTMGPNYLKKKQMKIHNRRRDFIVNRARKQKFKNKFDRESSVNSSKSGCLDLGEIYIKTTKNKTRTPKKREPRHKNAECRTTSITMIECQTATSNSIEPPPRDDKTEVTLNQIKAILQSVLTEVKTNNQVKDATEVKDKKDTVQVQKGILHSNAQGASSLLNSFTYSPYNLNPYTASCSRNLPPPNQYYYNGYNGSLQPKCLQNYPLFIQTPGRHVCASCYRNSSHVAKPVTPKYATTAGTNTGEICEERSKETEKLIKEIYKSMALTMDLGAKDTSLSETDDPKSTLKDSTEKYIGNSNNLKVVKEPDAISEQIRKKENQIRQFASQINAKSKSKTPSSPASRQSRELSTDTVLTNHRARKEVIEKYTTNKDIFQSTETEYDAQDLQQQGIVTSSDDETETTSSETDSDVTYVPAKDTAVKKEKKGLFSKFKSVFKSKEKKKKPESEEEESEVSDSDDYQTIYSQKIKRAPNRRVVNTPRKIKPHSKVIHSKQFHQRERKPEKSKRTPYMEQEYRRYWNEKLMFHENQNRKYSSERPYSREINQRYSPRTEYYRNYEARSALVEPHGQIYHPKLGMINARNTQPRIENPQLKSLPTKTNTVTKAPNGTAKGLSWLKNHKMDIRCGPQWKKMLLES